MSSTQTIVNKAEKDQAAMKHYLLGKNYLLALKAMSFAKKYHVGMRKDGVTPEFTHQVRMAFSVLNLRGVLNEEMVIALCFTHDTDEDYSVSYTDMKEFFGSALADKTVAMNKGNYKTEDDYMQAMANDLDCSVVKGVDNCDNIQTMHGAFSIEKMHSYMERTQGSILPMIKQSSYNFPQQAFAYAAISTRLKDQLSLYRSFLKKIL